MTSQRRLSLGVVALLPLCLIISGHPLVVAAGKGADCCSTVADGPLAGCCCTSPDADAPEPLMGGFAGASCCAEALERVVVSHWAFASEAPPPLVPRFTSGFAGA